MADGYEAVIPLTQVSMSPSHGSVVALNDGRLLWVWAYKGVHAITSDDGGRTWGEPRDVMLTTGEPMRGIMAVNLLRLGCGAVAMVLVSERGRPEFDASQPSQLAFHTSRDEGETWSPPVTINPLNVSAGVSQDKAMVLGDGRIIVPVDQYMGTKPTTDDPKGVHRMGQRFGNLERSSLVYSFAMYSDDEGQTWQRSRNEVIAQVERGFRGSYSFIEPAVVELKDGRLMMLGRTNLGSLYRSYSEDRGHTWLAPEPTDLALSPSPCCLQRIPKTGDLLVIWNQASRVELIEGVYRHRLTCAVSKDDGLSWQHHRNLESLDDVAHIEPVVDEMMLIANIRQPVDRQRYHRAPGPLRCNEPTCTFHDDNAVITYSHLELGDPAVITDTYGMAFHEVARKYGFTERPDRPGRYEGNNKVRILPTEWFYEK